MSTQLELLPGRLSLVVAPGAAQEALLSLAARLAQLRTLLVIDGGGCFNAYIVANLLRRAAAMQGEPSHYQQALERIKVSRVFTCYQMLALLQNIPAEPMQDGEPVGGKSTGATTGDPILVLDLLATFYDESVPIGERRRLLSLCLVELRRLGSWSPVGISARLPRPGQDPSLLEMLVEAADYVWRLELRSPPPSLQLF